MHSDNIITRRKTKPGLPQVLYRGIYGRVARKLGVDASYVSRVARGERYSRKIETALREELDQITNSLQGAGSIPREEVRTRSKGKRLKNFIQKHSASLKREFMAHSDGDPELRSVQITRAERGEPVPELLAECVKLMVYTPKQMRTMPTRAATHHGRLRQRSGFKARDVLEEYNLLRRCIFELAEQHFVDMDTHLLFHDISQVSEVLDLQMQNALKNYLRTAE